MSRFRAVPYAKALDQVVRAQCPERAEAVLGELERVVDAINQVPELSRALVTPLLDPAAKSEIVGRVLDLLGVTEPARQLVQVVQRHYRMSQMGEIAVAYRNLVDRAVGRTRARVEVAGVLSPAQQRQVVAALEGLVGGAVTAEFSSRPELLAGFRAQVGSKVFDGSLAGELDRVKRAAASE